MKRVHLRTPLTDGQTPLWFSTQKSTPRIVFIAPRLKASPMIAFENIEFFSHIGQEKENFAI